MRGTLNLSLLTELTLNMKGSQLLEIRKDLGLSQAAFASELGVSRTFLSLMERDLKPISRRTELSALHLKGDTSNVVNQVNNVNSVNEAHYYALCVTINRIFMNLMIETSVNLQPFFGRGKSKEVRKACEQMASFLSNLHKKEIEHYKLHLNKTELLPDKKLSARLIDELDEVVKLQMNKFGHL